MQKLHAPTCSDSGQQLGSRCTSDSTVATAGRLAQQNAGAKQKDDCHATTSQCLWLPTPPAKLDKHGLERQLPSALQYISLQRRCGRSVLICDDEGVDACVCVALAASLCRDLVDEDCAASSSGRNMSEVVHGVKAAARTRLAEISGCHPTARPTRTALKQVYHYVSWVVAQQGNRVVVPQPGTRGATKIAR